MEIRPFNVNDLDQLTEIDATIESTHYLHLETSGDDFATSIMLELRPLRTKSVVSNPLTDDLMFIWKQVACGADEAFALVGEHESQIVAAAIAQPRNARGVLKLLDIRVDSDFRRQGIGLAMLFQIIQHARENECRAIAAEVRTNNFPANQIALKAGFQITGIDTHRYSNHDLIKESAIVFWYLSLN